MKSSKKATTTKLYMEKEGKTIICLNRFFLVNYEFTQDGIILSLIEVVNEEFFIFPSPLPGRYFLSRKKINLFNFYISLFELLLDFVISSIFQLRNLNFISILIYLEVLNKQASSKRIHMLHTSNTSLILVSSMNFHGFGK